MELIKYQPKNVWDPFGDLWNIRNEMGRMLDTATKTDRNFTREWYPAVDIFEDKDHFTVKAELPGVDQKDIKLSISEGALTLKGTRKTDYEEKKAGYHRVERAYGEFTRSFQLPTEVNADKIAAKYKDGILEINIPKSEKVKPKEIAIKAE